MHRSLVQQLGFIFIVIAVGGCESDRNRRTGAGPAAPTGLPQSGVRTAEQDRIPTLVPLVPVDSSAYPGLVPFPPRNESFAFRGALEVKYRDGLRRQPTTSFVDVEGDIVWTQEYLRFRVNGCGHAESTQRVADQINGGPAAGVCTDVQPTGVVAFPPRDQSFAFRQELERIYRDVLRRTPVSTFVDVEGSIVWTQEYLRYRVNRCGPAGAQTNVFAQIDGRAVAPVCGEVGTIAGFWSGTSTYFNAPFTFDLVQNGTQVSGRYQDRHDTGFVSGTVGTGGSVLLDVNFGDTGIRFEGAFEGPNTVRGSIRGTVIGGVFPFEMIR
jgi:hypothetical protein